MHGRNTKHSFGDIFVVRIHLTFYVGLTDDELNEQVLIDLCAAIGCADLVAPLNANVERNGDRVTVTCNMTSQSWHLVCKGTTWIGPQTHDCREGKWILRRIRSL